jgi:hypothetical protein
MPHQEPGTTQEEPIVEASAPQQPAAYAQGPPAYEPIAGQDEWLAEPEELPRRPRRRLFGKGGNPIFLALLGVLLIACGFIGGVLIEKGETSSSTGSGAAASLASRFRALRGGTGSTATGGSAGASSGFVRPTAGTVAYLAGSTLYVTNSEGNTVKVTTSAATSVTKTVKSSVAGIHPGETVTITGTTGSGGAVSAESISVGSSAGGLAALFGGAGAGTGAGKGGAGGSGGGEPSLFGSGG